VIRLLIIDDDTELCELLKEYLQQEGLVTEAVHEGPPGIDRALSGDHDLVVLDVMLPDTSGFDVLRAIRNASDIPVLMLTARGDEVDRIVGLEMGADDYLAKPFNPRELLARLRAIHRRTRETEQQKSKSSTAEKICAGDLILDPATRTVSKNGQFLTMTSVEFSLLQELLQQIGQIVSREQLSESVLGRKLMMFDRSIDVHISNLRKKLGRETKELERIKTIRGAGYMYINHHSGN